MAIPNKIVPPTRTSAYVGGDGKPFDQFASWVTAVSDSINGIEVEGSPEGIIDAKRFSLCVDILTDTLYIKTTSAGILTGWQTL